MSVSFSHLDQVVCFMISPALVLIVGIHQVFWLQVHLLYLLNICQEADFLSLCRQVLLLHHYQVLDTLPVMYQIEIVLRQLHTKRLNLWVEMVQLAATRLLEATDELISSGQWMGCDSATFSDAICSASRLLLLLLLYHFLLRQEGRAVEDWTTRPVHVEDDWRVALVAAEIDTGILLVCRLTLTFQSAGCDTSLHGLLIELAFILSGIHVQVQHAVWHLG